jgi:iron complex outermembrane recepter protein
MPAMLPFSSPLAIARLRRWVTLTLLGIVLGTAGPVIAFAQTPAATLSGTVTDAHRNTGLAGARVRLEETGREVTTGTDGQFSFDNVPPGTYHLRVTATRFTSQRVEVVAGSGAPATAIALEPQVHYSEVVSVSPNPRDAFESYQPTSVLSGQELSLKLETSLGQLLKSEPGVADRSNGPGASRPVIRGLDGDRVLILENGQRTDDLSSQSADHGVAISPLAAERVEVVRGPATLLYGANAIGGLVNVVTDVIPTKPLERTEGALQVDFGTAAGEAGGAGDLTVGNRRFSLHVGGSAVRTGDVKTPVGDVPNSHSRTTFGHVGGSFTGEKGFVGGSYQYDDTKYGIPFVEEGETQLTPRRHTVGFRAQSRGLDRFVDAVRASANVRRYRHDELDGETIVTQFENDTVDFELMATTKPVAGRLQGTYGVSGSGRQFAALGEEALSPPVDQNNISAFTYQEATWSHVTLQFGGRVERASFTPEEGLRDRDFTNVSGSLGALFRPTDQTTLAVSVARAVRNPALEELYFFGPHIGNFAFEVGNPDLDAEKGLGVDVSYRWRIARASGEVSWFRNAIDNYVFRNPTGEVDEEEGLPIVEFTGADALLQGFEAHTDLEVTNTFTVELGLDYVRGTLRASDDPLPRMPPLRFIGGARYHWNALQVGGEVVVAAKQDRTFGAETPTDGYGLLKLFGVYSRPLGRQVHTVTARLDNVTNETYSNHLSFIKDLTPEIGRNFKVVYGVRF